MRRLLSTLLMLILATACGSRAQVTASPVVATQVARSSPTEFPTRTITPLCVDVPNPKRDPNDPNAALGQIQSNQDFVGVGAVSEMFAPVAFTLVIPGQSIWVEIVPSTVFTGGIARVEDLHLAVGTRVAVTICRKAFDITRVIGGYKGFHQLAAIGPAR